MSKTMRINLPARLYSSNYQTAIKWMEKREGTFLIDPSRVTGIKRHLTSCLMKVADLLGVLTPSTLLIPDVTMTATIDDSALLEKVSEATQRWLRLGYFPSELFLLVGQDLLTEIRMAVGYPLRFSMDFVWNVEDPDTGLVATYRGIDVLLLPHTGGFAVVPRKRFLEMLKSSNNNKEIRRNFER